MFAMVLKMKTKAVPASFSFLTSRNLCSLQALSIHDSAVCNCHSDNRLSDILALVRDGYSCTNKSATERVNYGLKLQHALIEFTEKFLPHMKEEEEVSFHFIIHTYRLYGEGGTVKLLPLHRQPRYGH